MRLVGLISRIFLLIAACSADQGDLSANQTAFFRSDDKVVTLKKSDTCETTLVNATSPPINRTLRNNETSVLRYRS